MQHLNKKIFLFAFIILFIACNPILVIAEDENYSSIKNEAVNPGSFYYTFKRLFEKGQVLLQFSKEAKVKFYEKQLTIRFSELNYVVKNKLLSEVQTSSERFAYQAGILSIELLSLNNKDSKNRIVDVFEKYGKLLEKLRDVYPANSSFWMLVQHDINTLKILSEQLK